MRISANLTVLFTDVPFLERPARATAAGFTGVEFVWPAESDLAALPGAIEAAGVTVALFNFDAGDMPAGDRGLCADVARTRRFRENVPVALELAGRLGCTRVCALVGLRDPEVELDAQLELARENVAFAATQADKQDVTVTVEAINSLENGPFLLDTTAKAIAFIDSVGAPNLMLQYDAYHMHLMEGGVTATLQRELNRIGHVQIADAPGRGEPGSGEIDFDALFGVLESQGYDGWVGAEYRPSTTRTEDSLGWMRKRSEVDDR